MGIKSGNMFTYSGRFFNPLEPDTDLIDIYDIANALSHIGRYGGHTRSFLSVAEHSIRVVDQTSRENGKWALLHDASEAYLGDIPAPLKYHEDFSFYREAERNLMKAICDKFDLDYEEPEEVKYFDMVVRATEMRDLTNIPIEFYNGYTPLTVRVRCFSPEEAYNIFIEYARMLRIL
jgi:hypothetical protein